MKRFRNLRKDQKTRDKYAEVKLRANDFIYPIFVVEGHHKRQPISSLHDVYRFSIDELIRVLEETISLGINKILLFGVIEESLKEMK